MLLATSSTSHTTGPARPVHEQPPRVTAASSSPAARRAPTPLAATPRRISSAPTAPAPNRRATLRDLYTFGLVSVFRRDSVLRLWEPLRETPRPHHGHSAD